MIPGCGRSGGDDEEKFILISSNVQDGETWPLNKPMVFTFSEPVDPSTVNLNTLKFTPAPALGGVPPVSGDFQIKASSNSTVIEFQPHCPTDPDNMTGGLVPGDAVTGQITYFAQAAKAGSPDGSVIRSQSGKELVESFSFSFVTPIIGNILFEDSKSPPPMVANAEDLPAILPLNLFSFPSLPLILEMDQGILVSSLNEDSIYMEFDDPSGTTVRLPTELTLIDNCNGDKGAVFALTFIGILPPGFTIRGFLKNNLSGLGENDTHDADIQFFEGVVDSGGSPTWDVIRESFADAQFEDPAPQILLPIATWGQGKLQAAPVSAGTDFLNEFVIGPGSVNGPSVVLNTELGFLKNELGVSVLISGGRIQARNFTILNGGILDAIGSNPLVIEASESIVNDGTIKVFGRNGAHAFGLGTANIPAVGGVARCGGGDGGDGSPLVQQSSAKGGSGNGPFNAPGGGAEGGHSAYWKGGAFEHRGAGGGGGNPGNKDVGPNGNLVSFCYGMDVYCTDCSSAPCQFIAGGLGSSCPSLGNYPTFLQIKTRPSLGEPGNPDSVQTTNGPLCYVDANLNVVPASTPGAFKVGGLDAVTGICLARGGKPNPGFFQDGDDENNFPGRKPVWTPALEIDDGGDLGGIITLPVQNRTIINGEIPGFLGGPGGGGGGDQIRNSIFPNPAYVSATGISDRRAGGGGAGGGIVILQSPRIELRGTIDANGGGGGGGEKYTFNNQAAGGGGGGGGGTVLLETQSLFFANTALITATGGNRGTGAGKIPGSPVGSGPAKTSCILDHAGGRGGAGGKGSILFRGPFDSDKKL